MQARAALFAVSSNTQTQNSNRGSGVMKKFYRTIAAALALTLLLSLSGCGTSDGKTHLVFQIWDVYQRPGMEAICAAYTAQHPDVEIEVQVTSWGEYWTKLEAAAESKPPCPTACATPPEPTGKSWRRRWMSSSTSARRRPSASRASRGRPSPPIWEPRKHGAALFPPTRSN